MTAIKSRKINLLLRNVVIIVYISFNMPKHLEVNDNIYFNYFNIVFVLRHKLLVSLYTLPWVTITLGEHSHRASLNLNPTYLR
jgi:hypothetical protein